MNRWGDLGVLHLINGQWIPYIKAHQDALPKDYFDVLRRFPRHPPIAYRGLFSAFKLQAAAAVYPRKDCLYVALLLTAPWNKVERIKGAGSCLLRSLVIESKNLGTKGVLRLNAVPSAVDFYKRRGFAIAQQPKRPDWDYPMVLTSKAASSLLEADYAYPVDIN